MLRSLVSHQASCSPEELERSFAPWRMMFSHEAEYYDNHAALLQFEGMHCCQHVAVAPVTVYLVACNVYAASLLKFLAFDTCSNVMSQPSQYLSVSSSEFINFSFHDSTFLDIVLKTLSLAILVLG